MYEKLAQVERRFEDLNSQLADPKILQSQNLFKDVAKEHKELSPVVETWRELKRVDREIEENKELASDSDLEMQELARDELENLGHEKEELNERLKILLVPKDPLDGRDVFLEIRAGTGGDEAALFGAVLFRMYSRVAENKKWKVDIVNSNETAIGGFKEVIAHIRGKEVYSFLKYESGVHRVQRVPETESSGRIHTSTVTVAVLPEAEEVDFVIEAKDLRFDVYRSSGPGGQSVNTTDSAVRVTHIPTGLIVQCQDEKSQHKNKAKALKVLRARLLEADLERQKNEVDASRRAQIGTGGRSERIRTYNFPENRVTDHRISLTLYKLDSIVEGTIDGLIEPLRANAQAEALQGTD